MKRSCIKSIFLKKKKLIIILHNSLLIMKNITKSHCNDENEFILSSSTFIANKIKESIQKKDKCIIGLSGGIYLKFHFFYY